MITPGIDLTLPGTMYGAGQGYQYARRRTCLIAWGDPCLIRMCVVGNDAPAPRFERRVPNTPDHVRYQVFRIA